MSYLHEEGECHLAEEGLYVGTVHLARPFGHHPLLLLEVVEDGRGEEEHGRDHDDEGQEEDGEGEGLEGIVGRDEVEGQGVPAVEAGPALRAAGGHLVLDLAGVGGGEGDDPDGRGDGTRVDQHQRVAEPPPVAVGHRVARGQHAVAPVEEWRRQGSSVR